MLPYHYIEHRMIKHHYLLLPLLFAAWLLPFICLLYSWDFNNDLLFELIPGYKDSCYCPITTMIEKSSNNSDCICSPSLAIEAIIEIQDDNKDISIILIERRDPPRGYAIPGGFVNIGETVEECTLREIKEETNLHLHHIEFFQVYSDPGRDQRRHTTSVVFRCLAPINVSQLSSGDDAKNVRIIKIRDALNLSLMFDHTKMLRDYVQRYHSSLLNI